MAARVRTVLLGTAAVAGSLLVAGCDTSKPTPYVTVTAAGKTYHVMATQYCREGTCKNTARDVPVVEVKAGQLVGVDVDRSIARGTWTVNLVNGQQAIPFASGTNSHYESFTAPTPQQSGVTIPMFVDVVKSETGKPQDRTGRWLFQLRLDT